MTGVPTSISDRESSCLSRWARDKRVIEAGALLGGSTIILARAARHVVSIDRHEGYSGPTLAGFLSNLERAGVRGKVIPVVGDAIQMMRFPGMEFGFLDLTGEWDSTFYGIHYCSAKIIGIHDLGRPNCAGVEKAISYARLKVIEHVDTLAICVKGG